MLPQHYKVRVSQMNHACSEFNQTITLFAFAKVVRGMEMTAQWEIMC